MKSSSHVEYSPFHDLALTSFLAFHVQSYHSILTYHEWGSVIVYHILCTLILSIATSAEYKLSLTHSVARKVLQRYTYTCALFTNRKLCTVKPVLSDHLKIDKTKVLMENGRLMKVKSIAECSPWSILQYFWPALSDNWH